MTAAITSNFKMNHTSVTRQTMSYYDRISGWTHVQICQAQVPKQLSITLLEVKNLFITDFLLVTQESHMNICLKSEDLHHFFNNIYLLLGGGFLRLATRSELSPVRAVRGCLVAWPGLAS